MRTNGLICACLVAGSCAGDKPSVDTSAPVEEVGVESGADVAPAYCPGGHAPPIGKLCVLGDTFVDAGVNDAEPDEDAGATKPAYRLVAGEPVRFKVYPKGCFSERCSRVDEAVCSVASSDGAKIALEGAFCLKPKSGQACGTDCSGGGVAQCSSEPLAAGSYTAAIGELSLSFAVPSEVPNEGLCAVAE